MRNKDTKKRLFPKHTKKKNHITYGNMTAMLDLNNFNWGWMDHPVELSEGVFSIRVNSDGTTKHMSHFHRDSMIEEIFNGKIYEKFFDVDSGDLVVDIGASVGPFTYSILHKNPKHVYCFEPSIQEFRTLNKNLRGYPVTTINKGISNVNSIVESSELFGGENEMEAITFKTFIENYSIDKIDFLKTDCEGGEYDIFNEENMDFILNNVKKISGEWHLNTPETKEKFVFFRDRYLTAFDNFYVHSIDGVDIKWDLWNDHFLEYYNEVIISIDNR
jgi:FkbM family methyltransferase